MKWAFSGVITFSAMFYLPQFFQVALNYTPIHAGLFLIPVLGGQVVVSWVAVSTGFDSLYAVSAHYAIHFEGHGR